MYVDELLRAISCADTLSRIHDCIARHLGPYHGIRIPESIESFNIVSLYQEVCVGIVDSAWSKACSRAAGTECSGGVSYDLNIVGRIYCDKNLLNIVQRIQIVVAYHLQIVNLVRHCKTAEDS